MVLLLALLPSALAQAPPSCSGLPTALCGIEPGFDCAIDAGLYTTGPGCYPIAGSHGPLRISGSGTVFVYNATGLGTASIERLVVDTGADVVVYDPDPYDGSPAIRIQVDSPEPSVEVIDAELELQGTDVRGNGPDAVAPLGRRGAAIIVRTGGVLTMTSGEISSGFAQYGGGLFVDEGAEAAVYDTWFHGNGFSPSPGDFSGDPYVTFKGRDVYSAGTLHLEGTTHETTDSGFGDGVRYGGAIYAGGFATIGTATSPVELGYYQAGTGGAVMAGPATASDGVGVSCSNVSIAVDLSTGSVANNGGGIAAQSCDEVSVQGTFVDTFAYEDGGALWAVSVPELYVDASTFTATTALTAGGAIYVETVDDAYVDHTVFFDTYGSTGGAIWQGESAVVLTNSLIDRTASATGASAITLEDDGDLWVEGTAFCESGQSGDLIYSSGPYVNLNHSWFEGTGTIHSASGGFADHITVSSSAGRVFGGGWWDLTDSIVDGATHEAGSVSTGNNTLFTNIADALPDYGTAAPLVWMESTDGLSACSLGNPFRLAADVMDPVVVGDPSDPFDDWGAFGGMVVGDRFLPLLVDGDDIDWAADDDGDGWPNAVDCHILDMNSFPGAPETCDGVDNDCDGSVDEDAIDATDWFLDTDNDGYGDDTDITRSCDDPLDGRVSVGGDCNDGAVEIHPGATEVCDGADSDCNGDPDDIDPDADPAVTGTVQVYPDPDGDGFVSPDTEPAFWICPGAVVEDTMEPADGAVVGDCAPYDEEVNPEGEEVCDGVDNDCDGLTDGFDDDMTGTPHPDDLWARDGDEDGFTDGGPPIAWCADDEPPSGPYAPQSEEPDCNDANPDTYPGAPERCDGEDNDCDPTSLEAPVTRFEDADADGLGNPDAPRSDCPGDLPDDYVDNDLDCDDDDASIGEPQPYYVDGDGDLFGDEEAPPQLACPDEALRERLRLDNTDCDDDLPEVNPGRTEIVGNGVDDDCSGGDAETWAAGGCASCSATGPDQRGAPLPWPGVFRRRR